MSAESCDQIIGLLSDALAGDLDAATAGRLTAHLDGCARCRALADALVRQDLALAELAGQAQVVNLTARLHDALAMQNPRRADAAAIVAGGPNFSLPRRPFAALPWWAWGAAALAASIVMVTAIVYETRQMPNVPQALGPSSLLPADGSSRADAHSSPPITSASAPVLAEARPAPQHPVGSDTAPRRQPIAVLTAVQGNVVVLADSADNVGTPAKAEQPLYLGQGLWAKDEASFAAIQYPDQTVLQLAAKTHVRCLGGGQGKDVELADGSLTAAVMPQPPDRPMTITTPKAEAVVLGTKLRLAANEQVASLKVEQGRVRFIRREDSKALEVPQGHYAVVAKDIEFAVRPLTPPGPRWAVLREHTGALLAAAYSPDGRTLATAGNDATIRLWDPASKTVRATLKGHTAPIEALAFAPDGQTLASASWDRSIRLWDVTTGKLKKTLDGHASTVSSVAFAPDGQTLASGGFDKTVKVWSVVTGKERLTIDGHQGAVRSVAFAPNGKLLASGSADGSAGVWDPIAGANLRWLRGHGGWVYRVAFAPDSRTLAAGCGDGIIHLWDVPASMDEQRLTEHKKRITALAVTPDGRQLISSSTDGSVRFWDLATGKESNHLSGGPLGEITAIAIAPDGKTLAIGNGDGSLVLWDMAKETNPE